MHPGLSTQSGNGIKPHFFLRVSKLSSWTTCARRRLFIEVAKQTWASPALPAFTPEINVSRAAGKGFTHQSIPQGRDGTVSQAQYENQQRNGKDEGDTLHLGNIGFMKGPQ